VKSRCEAREEFSSQCFSRAKRLDEGAPHESQGNPGEPQKEARGGEAVNSSPCNDAVCRFAKSKKKTGVPKKTGGNGVVDERMDEREG